MTTFILMNATQRSAIRGKSNAYSAIEPVERQGATYILNSLVLADGAHLGKRGTLNGYTKMEDNDPGFPAELPAAAGQSLKA